MASFEDGRLVVETSVGAELGDSVALDGVCLTVVAARNGMLEFDVVPETLSRAKPFLGRVNVEPALRAGDPLGGHYVQGHVDAPPEVLRYCVEKGSITVDGVSLTIAGLAPDAFVVALVPHTVEITTLGELEQGSQVNLETDVLAKYVERAFEARQA